jgi:hypothetical protein
VVRIYRACAIQVSAALCSAATPTACVAVRQVAACGRFDSGNVLR